MNNISLEQAEYWSSFQKICVDLRLKGLRVSMERLREGEKELPKILDEMRQSLTPKLFNSLDFNEGKFNIDSHKQIAKALVHLGYNLPKSLKTGQPSCNRKWLDQQKGDPLLEELKEYRSVNVIFRDFFQKPLHNMRYTCPEALLEGAKYGRVYPTYKLFGAAATGRFSSSHPNCQNIPTRNKQFGKLCRSIFCKDKEDTKWYKLDWSGQEPRLIIHFGMGRNYPSALKIGQELKENPHLNLHKYAYAEMYKVNIESVTAKQKEFVKPINLGLGYGMRSGALAKSIGLPTEYRQTENGFKYEVAGEQAQEVLNRHKKALPYIYDLMDLAAKRMAKNGYVVTIGGRKVKKRPHKKDYVGLNCLIQGSGSDMMYKALKMAYEAGLDIKCIVHDEFNIEGTIDNAREMLYIMENTYPLRVPMIAEVSCGDDWGSTEEIKLDDKINI